MSLVVHAQMLIRKPVEEVFEAFINPEVTTKFWFSRASGPLEVGKRVRWEWEMYGVGTDVQVQAIDENKRIRLTWDEPPCPVEWEFHPRADGTTLVKITNSGFHGSHEEQLAQAIDAKGGFATVLAGLKAWLEHGVQLNMVSDQFPENDRFPE